MGIIGLLLCFCLYLMPCHAQAVSTADAVEPIFTARECTLTISYVYEGNALSGAEVKLYKIADVSADFRYTLAESFLSSALILNGIQSDAEWNTIRTTLESYILANGVAETTSAVTDQAGQASFEALRPGLYLAVPKAARNSLRCTFDSALISLPGLRADGRWEYEVSVAAKFEVLPPAPTPPGPTPEPENEKQLKVLKLWKGDEGQENRPASVEVEIYKDGTSYQKVVLSEENNWSFRWTVKDDGAEWMVVERNVPAGYTVTVDEHGGAFILTNTWVPEDSPAEEPSDKPPELEDVPPGETPKDDKTDVPETGDTPHIMLFTVLMYASGMLLIILGVTGKRREHEE